MDTIREKTEQVITPLKAELIWFLILILVIGAAIVGMRVTYKMGFRDGVTAEKIGWLEDYEISRQQKVRNGQK